MASKRVDLIVANDVAAPGAGFAHDTNAVVIVDADGRAPTWDWRTSGRSRPAVVDAVVAYRRNRPIPGGADTGGDR